jgi:hypothetical protein
MLTNRDSIAEEGSLRKIPSDASLRTKLAAHPTTTSLLNAAFQRVNSDMVETNKTFSKQNNTAKTQYEKELKAYNADPSGSLRSPTKFNPTPLLQPLSRPQFDTMPRQTFVSSQSDNPAVIPGLYTTPKGRAIADEKLKRVSAKDTIEKKGLRARIQNLMKLGKK